MNEKIERINSFFRALTGNKLDMKLYENRILIQKMVYILQCAKINFDYRFTWYLKGPYSIKLSHEEFLAVENKTRKEAELEANEKEIIEKLKNEFGTSLSNEKDMELIGSLLFIQYDMKVNEKEKIIEKLTTLKPWFKHEQTEAALNKINATGLFN